jgi:membrane protease YdiL (CAAX protease family)
MNNVFLNNYGRLRSGWRASVFVFVFIFFFTGWGILADILTSITKLGINPGGLFFWSVSLVFNIFLATVLGWLCGKVFEGLPLKALGWAFYRGWLRDLSLGFVIGAITLIFSCLVCVVFGGMSFAMNSSAGTSAIGITLAVSAVVFILGAAAEEVMFRGYLMQTFTRAGLAWAAIIFTSLIFASGHIANPNFNALAMINTVLAGLWFSAAYLKTRSLWLPFTAHFAWNWFQGAIFGIPVSGITKVTTAPLLIQSDAGPAWLTGGSYGIEGGVACAVALLISTILIYFLPLLKADPEMVKLTSQENPVKEPHKD